MTKRHFELIAETLRKTLEREQSLNSPSAGGVRMSARELADVLGSTNSRFDKERFLRACGVEA